jgi:two-component system alkaline phosphatase synthesis response regulator PhoP
MKQIIFIVEDEAAIRELYTYALEADYQVNCFTKGEEMFTAIAATLPDIILLDIMLEGDDGFEILAKLKGNNKLAYIPVIMVSAKGEEISKVKGLNLGADDYIAKPFGILELIARIKANLRKNTNEKKSHTAYKDIKIDEEMHQIIIGDSIIQSTLKEYNLLKLLIENAHKVINREDIFTLVWSSDFIGETRTLDMHIKELRKKLALCDSACKIETVRGVGYMLL